MLNKKIVSLGLAAALALSVLPFGVPSQPLGIVAKAEEVRNVTIDAKYTYIGESVTVMGQSTFSDVTVKVLTPGNEVLFYDVVPTKGGTYEVEFTLPEDAKAGNYTIIAGKGSDVVSLTFPGKEKPKPVPAPSKPTKPSKKYWNGVEVKKYQIGKVDLKGTSVLYKHSTKGWVKVKTLKSGSSFRVYKVDSKNKFYNVGGGLVVKFDAKVKYTVLPANLK